MTGRTKKMEPIFDEQENLVGIDLWVSCQNATKKISMVYRPELDCDLAFANAGSEHIRTRTMQNEKEELMLLALKQGDQVILPRGVDFVEDAFVYLDENGKKKEIPYKILILDENDGV